LLLYVSGGLTVAPEERKGTRGPESEVERRYHEVLALSRISAALSGLSNLDAILTVALDNLLAVMNGAIGGILLLDDRTKTLTYRVHHGFSRSFADGVRLGLGEGVIGRAAQSGKAILLEDISTDSRAALPALVTAEGLKAFVAVPLTAKDTVLGVITVASHEARRFTPNDVHLLHSIADQVSVAIEQAGLNERLRRARDRLRRLARLNLVTEEEERRRIARELHDETSQTLSGLALQLQALIERTEVSHEVDAEFVAGLQRVQSLTVQVHKEISRLIGDLRPALLDTLGLVPAARQHAESRLALVGIPVSVDVRGQVRRLPANVEVTLFRWIQGAVGNIVKHSQAKQAEVIFEFKEGDLTVSVRDNGVGFDVSKITDIEENGRGRGLFSMRERIGSLNGTGGVESIPGLGTTVWARVPTK
jgi:signal transduction histidine kinase